MKKLCMVLAAMALAGCSSYSELAKWDSAVTVNDGETPVASFLTQNFQYELFYCVPICTGVPWIEGEGPIVDEYHVRWFKNEATVDNNLKSLNHALDLAGSHRIAQLRTTVNDEAWWSFFIFNRHEVRTSCLILPDLEEVARRNGATAIDMLSPLAEKAE